MNDVYITPGEGRPNPGTCENCKMKPAIKEAAFTDEDTWVDHIRWVCQECLDFKLGSIVCFLPVKKSILEWQEFTSPTGETWWEGWLDRVCWELALGRRKPYWWQVKRHDVDPDSVSIVAKGKASSLGRAVGAGKRCAERDAKKGESS